MLVQSTKDEGATLERPSEPQPTPSPPHPSEANVEPQSDPSPRPSPTPHIPDSILEVSGGNHGGQSSSDKSLSGNEGGMTLQSVLIKKLKKQAKPVITHHRAWMKSISLKQRLAGKKTLKANWMQKESVSKQGRKSAKAEPSVHKDPLFDELDDDEIDNMDTEDAQDVGRTREVVDEEKEGTKDAVSTEDVVSTDKEKVSTDRSKDSTDKEEEGTDKDKDSTVSLDEGTDDRTSARSATPITSTTTPTMFGDDETIAQVLLNMSQAKAVSKEKEKGVELKDVEETGRPRPISTRSLLTLKPLPKIDPKDKGKKKIEEKDEFDTESEDIPEVEKEREQFNVEERAKFLHDTIAAQRRFLAEQRAITIRNKPPTRTQLRNQMMTYLKHDGNKKHSDLKSKTFEEIQALYEKLKRFNESFTAVGSTEDEKRIKEMNEGVKDTNQKRLKEEDTSDVHSDDEYRKCLRIVEFEGTIDNEIMEKKSVIARLDNLSSPDGDYLVIYRANGNFRAFNYLMEVLHIFNRQDLFHLYELIMEQYSEITLEGFELILWEDLKIMMESSTRENDQICILELEDRVAIHMLVERRYPLSKDLLERMLDLGLEVERESTVALDLIRVFNSPCFTVKSWLVQDQTVLGKDYSNLLIADSLLKTIWFINAPCYSNEALASPKANELTIPEQTATGKGTSNPFMADSAYTIGIHSHCFYIVNLYLYKLVTTLSRLQRSIQFGTHRSFVVQNVQGRQNQNQRYLARGNGAAGNGGAHNRAGNANVVLDEEELLFLTGEQVNTFDVDVDNQPVKDLALNEDNIFQADESRSANQQAGPSNASILSEVHILENAIDHSVTNLDEHEIHNEVQQANVIDSTSVDMGNSNVIPYEQYLSVDNISVVPSCASSALNDVCVSSDNYAFVPHDPIATELKIYKEQVAIYEQRAKFELTEREQRMDDQMRMLIQNRNKTEENLKKELHSVKLQLNSTMENNKIFEETVTTLKHEFKQKESKFLTDFSNLKHLNDKLENKLHSQDQSIQTVHMMLNPAQVYDQRTKTALGAQNPFHLRQAKKAQPALYDGEELLKTHHVPVNVPSSEEELELAETTRNKLHAKMNDSACVEKRVNITPPNYSKENFMATFTPQTQLTPEQVFWSIDLEKRKAEELKANAPPLPVLPPATVYPPNTPVHLVPRTLPTTSQVNIGLYVITQLFWDFEKTCKKRITPTGITEGERGFEQTKRCYLTEVIPFFNLLKEHFDGVQKSLVTEVRAMKAVFENLEAEVDQNEIDLKSGEIERKNLLITNENLIVTKNEH
ncbi:hypothetical protein Tco_0975759 [Tanacetum coccineum]|uniref:Uncharacterized protein n=1 Tax=Tanacetum coccineum TaxID=301880 RepID=A0ABQ5EGH8_9ASTR